MVAINTNDLGKESVPIGVIIADADNNLEQIAKESVSLQLYVDPRSLTAKKEVVTSYTKEPHARDSNKVFFGSAIAMAGIAGLLIYTSKPNVSYVEPRPHTIETKTTQVYKADSQVDKMVERAAKMYAGCKKDETLEICHLRRRLTANINKINKQYERYGTLRN